ncbi:MAG: hypothetical protein U9Q76_01615, partial [candidate division WOR-3 bacterium]|nr:hypothetical protein [candidate division WOR-3 bacterium]
TLFRKRFLVSFSHLLASLTSCFHFAQDVVLCNLQLIKIRKEQDKETWAKTLLFEIIRFIEPTELKMSINNRQGKELLSYATTSLIKHADKFIGAIKKDGWIKL